MDPAVAAIYLQLITFGIPWTLMHCSGMCGPIILSMRLGAHGGGRVGALPALRDLGSYQIGRTLVYTACGAAAGLLGSTVSSLLRPGAIIVATIIAIGFVAAAVAPWLRTVRTISPLTGGVMRYLAPLSRLRERHRAVGLVITGIVFAGLPCGIAFWVLALAATTASPFHGALLMMMLVVMSSLPLAVVSVLPHAAHRLRLRAPRWLIPAMLLISAGITLATAVAAACSHPSCPFCLVHR